MARGVYAGEALWDEVILHGGALNGGLFLRQALALLEDGFAFLNQIEVTQ